MKHVGGAALLVAALAISAPVWADSPMTPLRPLSGPGGASQWLEPPPAAKPPPESPEATADTATAAAPPEERPARQAIARPDRDPSPPSDRRAARTGARGSYTTRQLNRQQLRALGLGAGASYYSSPYDPGYGPAPYSSHGD